jgi:hypothetical protein
MNQTNSAPASRENVGLGILGAFLFALVGGIVYYVLWSIGIIAALSGIIGVICAIKGYEIFARRSTGRGIAISVIAAALVLIFAWYFCHCTDVQAYYRALYEAGEIEFVPSMGVCLLYGFLDLPANPGYFGDLFFSLAMGGMGCWGYVTYTLRRQEAISQRRAEQARTMELARAQAEQAARYASEQPDEDKTAQSDSDQADTDP